MKSSQSSKGKPGGANIVMESGYHDKEVTEGFSSRYLSCGYANQVSVGEVNEK